MCPSIPPPLIYSVLEIILCYKILFSFKFQGRTFASIIKSFLQLSDTLNTEYLPLYATDEGSMLALLMFLMVSVTLICIYIYAFYSIWTSIIRNIHMTKLYGSNRSIMDNSKFRSVFN